MSQGAASPRTQETKHRANHSDEALFLSKHTHKHRANHSSAILLEQTFQIVSMRIAGTSHHYKLSYKYVTEVSTDV